MKKNDSKWPFMPLIAIAGLFLTSNGIKYRFKITNKGLFHPLLRNNLPLYD
ncbi:MAG: hypothetical protein JWQ28_716 [Pedobacter sp.]|nr:hypothetical protein [Pedobacter sp.]